VLGRRDVPGGLLLTSLADELREPLDLAAFCGTVRRPRVDGARLPFAALLARALCPLVLAPGCSCSDLVGGLSWPWTAATKSALRSRPSILRRRSRALSLTARVPSPAFLRLSSARRSFVRAFPTVGEAHGR